MTTGIMKWLKSYDVKDGKDRWGRFINPNPFNRRGWWVYCGWTDLPYWFWYGFFLHQKNRLEIWWFWWSPPFMKTKRCPQCAGAGSYGADYGDVLPCDLCGRTGRTEKHPRLFWQVFPSRNYRSPKSTEKLMP